jgi:hypothetical protein
VSPLSTLARGYAIVTTVATGQVVRSDDHTPGAYGALLALLGDRVASSGGDARGLQGGLEVVGHVWPRGRSPGRRTEPSHAGRRHSGMGAEPDTPGTTCGSGAADGDLRRYPAEQVRPNPLANPTFANPPPHGAQEVLGPPVRLRVLANGRV